MSGELHKLWAQFFDPFLKRRNGLKKSTGKHPRRARWRPRATAAGAERLQHDEAGL